ncbi:hypothetical protein DEO48_00710 [Enterobacter sp. CGMCC 5087]|nr:hypothetical protein DEO48_00710 [Enterobacter sp. CGMCC 5087]
MRITLAEELLNELETLSKSEWKLAGELTEAQMKIAGLEKVHELFLRAKALMYQSGGTPGENSLNPIDSWLYDAERAEIQEYRKAATPEMKLAHLINKFYERYPLAGFKNDSERSEALGYFMAGAELQCFGEFVKYEDLCADE